MAGFTQLTDEQESQLLNSNVVSSTPQIEEDKDDDVQVGFTQLTTEQDIALSDGPIPKPAPEYVSTKERLANQTDEAFSTQQEAASEPVAAEPESIKSLSEDDQFVEDILQYRKDRFGVEKDVGGANLVFGYMLGEQEQTNENIVDDYMDHYRFVTGNSLDAGLEVGWLESLTEKENDIKKSMATASGADLDELTDEANVIAEKKARALRLYSRADKVGNLFNSKRYEGMNALEFVSDLADNISGNVVAGLSDPMTALTAGVGRIIGGAVASAGVTPFKSAILAAAATAPLEAGGAATTDIMVQNAEIEMGARDEIDYERTSLVAGSAALLTGALTYKGVKNTATRVDKATRGELSQALVAVQEAQTKLAEKTNAKLGFKSQEIRERLAKGIEDSYGKEAILRNKDGTVKGMNSKFIRESEGAKKTAKALDFDEELYQPALSFSTFERVTASVGEVMEGLRKGDIKIDAEKLAIKSPGLKVSDLTSKLQKNETVSERLLSILSATEDASFDATSGILGKYGVTQREIAATMFADASRAGQTLNRLSRMSEVVGRATRNKSAGQIKEEGEDIIVREVGSNFAYYARRLEDIRRLTLVSGVGTAVRNNFSQYIRSGVDTIVYGLESALNPDKKFGLKNTIAQLEHTFYDPKDAATISQFLLDLAPKQKTRFFNQYSEVTNTVNKKNPSQAALSKQSGGLQKNSPILDKWEGIVTSLNGLNRYQEAVYRQGMFTASVQRQLFNKVATKTDVDTIARSLAKAKNTTIAQIKDAMKTKEGGPIDILEVLNSGEVSRYIDEDMVAKSVDDALDFTYANQPEWGPFKTLNSLIVNSYATLGIPFPRFMFKAIEMTYNYNMTGVATGLYRLATKGKKNVGDREFRRIAEGITGTTTLLPLGYLLRDPDGQTAGSEWYMLKDGKGNEFDARPFFPLTPYLLFGEMIHRATDERYAGGVFKLKEAVEGLTGANFRGTGAASRFLEDMFAAGTDSSTELEFNMTLKEMGGYLGEALSGYGQPVYQLADVYADNYQRMKDYKTDLDMNNGEGLVRDLGSFFSGVFQPFNSRIQRVLDSAGMPQEDVPFKEDPRTADIPERVMPFMKIMFGATLNRVPPLYIQELSRYGFKYTDFMARTNSPSVDRFINREMGIIMNKEMPEAIATAKEEHPDDGAAQASLIKEYISDMKSGLYAQIKTADEDTVLNSMLQRYLKMSPYHRRSAVKQWKKDTGESPDLQDAETLDVLLEWGSSAKRLAKQR
jgi:hypothetical protein